MSRAPDPRALRVFDLLFLPWMRRRLHGPLMEGLPSRLPPDRPLLLASNHVSWWDAFVLREVHRALRPRAPLHTVMLEGELRRLPLFRPLGAVGFRPGAPASVGRAVRLLAERVRSRPDSIVLFFPQGRIWPTHRRPLGFERGVELLARRIPNVLVIPAAIHIEPLARAAPTAFVSLGRALDPAVEPVSAPLLEERVVAALDRLRHFLAMHGEGAAAAWPPPADASMGVAAPGWSS